MVSDHIVKLILFSARRSRHATNCVSVIQNMNLPIPLAIVYADTIKVRERLMASHFKIDCVPTLLIIYEDETASMITGMDDIIEWAKITFEAAAEPDPIPVVENVPEIIDVTPSTTSRTLIQNTPMADEGFSSFTNMKEDNTMFGPDVKFIQPELPMQPSHDDYNGMPPPPPMRTGNIHQMAELMKQDSGLDTQ